jgi:hypothetical protein
LYSYVVSAAIGRPRGAAPPPQASDVLIRQSPGRRVALIFCQRVRKGAICKLAQRPHGCQQKQRYTAQQSSGVFRTSFLSLSSPSQCRDSIRPNDQKHRGLTKWLRPSVPSHRKLGRYRYIVVLAAKAVSTVPKAVADGGHVTAPGPCSTHGWSVLNVRGILAQ